jgi:sec-independent protein translocase protein TatB
MLRRMFGMGMGELLLILVVALLVVGPDKLPQAAKAIGKGIRDFRRHTIDLQSTLEQDEKLGEAVRELRSALRDDPFRPLRTPLRAPVLPDAPTPSPALPDAASVSDTAAPGSEAGSPAGPPAVVPAAGTVPKQPPGTRQAVLEPPPRPDDSSDPPHG